NDDTDGDKIGLQRDQPEPPVVDHLPDEPAVFYILVQRCRLIVAEYRHPLQAVHSSQVQLVGYNCPISAAIKNHLTMDGPGRLVGIFDNYPDNPLTVQHQVRYRMVLVYSCAGSR